MLERTVIPVQPLQSSTQNTAWIVCSLSPSLNIIISEKMTGDSSKKEEKEKYKWLKQAEHLMKALPSPFLVTCGGYIETHNVMAEFLLSALYKY